jgi:3-hydroxy-3-methylglutaryl CoA synthase
LISIEEVGKLTATSDVPKRMALGVDAGLTRGVGRLLGNSEAIVDKIWTEIGDAGAAAAPCALVATLDIMRANETVLAVGVGAGATAVAFRAGGGLSENRRKGRKFSELIKCGRVVNYIDYLKHKRLLSSRTGGKG